MATSLGTFHYSGPQSAVDAWAMQSRLVFGETSAPGGGICGSLKTQLRDWHSAELAGFKDFRVDHRTPSLTGTDEFFSLSTVFNDAAAKVHGAYLRLKEVHDAVNARSVQYKINRRRVDLVQGASLALTFLGAVGAGLERFVYKAQAEVDCTCDALGNPIKADDAPSENLQTAAFALGALGAIGVGIAWRLGFKADAARAAVEKDTQTLLPVVSGKARMDDTAVLNDILATLANSLGALEADVIEHKVTSRDVKRRMRMISAKLTFPASSAIQPLEVSDLLTIYGRYMAKWLDDNPESPVGSISGAGIACRVSPSSPVRETASVVGALKPTSYEGFTSGPTAADYKEEAPSGGVVGRLVDEDDPLDPPGALQDHYDEVASRPDSTISYYDRPGAPTSADVVVEVASVDSGSARSLLEGGALAAPVVSNSTDHGAEEDALSDDSVPV